MAEFETCGGTLLVHGDGTAAACTEELEGRCCGGADAAHDGGAVLCEEVLGPGGCEVCALEAWTAGDWRHAARVGVIARRARRCRRRQAGAAAPSASSRSTASRYSSTRPSTTSRALRTPVARPITWPQGLKATGGALSG